MLGLVHVTNIRVVDWRNVVELPKPMVLVARDACTVHMAIPRRDTPLSRNFNALQT